MSLCFRVFIKINLYGPDNFRICFCNIILFRYAKCFPDIIQLNVTGTVNCCFPSAPSNELLVITVERYMAFQILYQFNVFSIPGNVYPFFRIILQIIQFLTSVEIMDISPLFCKYTV